MSVRNLAPLFAPKTVAVIGASSRPGSVGNTVLGNLSASGSSVSVFPVNPKHQVLGDKKCFASVAEIPDAVDLAVICTPATTVPQLVRECGAAGVRGVLILSAGFRETGSAGKQLEAAVAAEASKFEGLRILGPNCLGYMAPHLGLNVSFVNDMPPQGSVAFISQSGALCSSVLDWAKQANVGFSYFISLGNMLDVGMADVIDYLATDRWTE